MTLENRSGRDRDPDHLFLDLDPRQDLPSTRLLPRFLGLRRCGSFLHTARLNVRAAFQTFQPGDLLALFGQRLLQAGDFTEQSNQQSLKLCPGQRGEGGRRRHMMQRVRPSRNRRKEKMKGCPHFCPSYRPRSMLLKWPLLSPVESGPDASLQIRKSQSTNPCPTLNSDSKPKFS